MSTAPAEPRSGAPSSGANPALAQIREAAQSLLGDGHTDEAFELFAAALDAVLRKNRELELLVARLRRAGVRSEQIDPGQLALLLEQLQALEGGLPVERDPETEARDDATLEAEIEVARAAQRESRPEPTRPAGRSWRTRDIAQVVHTVDVPEADRACGSCGRVMARLGTDLSHRLEYIPAHFVEHTYERAKFACGHCKDAVLTAPAPPQVLERSAADASVLAHVVVSKYADHCPLHRLHRIFDRHGVAVPVSTLADWVGGTADVLTPLVERLAARVRTAFIVRTDATGLKVLDPTHPAHIQQGTMWSYVGDDRDVLFRYAPTGEGASGPWAFLAGRTGYIHADGASVFDRLYTGQVATATEIACWAHGRRRLVALQDTDCRVAYPIKLITRLYRIERLADARELTTVQRAALRQERGPPVLETLQRWLVATAAKEPPSSDLSKAVGYLLRQWTALTRFLEDGRISLDNNLCERQLRDIAIGRKNFLFSGSHAAAARAAVLYSLLRTAALHGVAPLEYLTDVLRTLASGWPADRLDELLPDQWQARHPVTPPASPSASARPDTLVSV